MQLNTLIPVHKNTPTMLVGRGGRRGKTCGRGTKGQNARSGHKKRPELRDFIKRLPKLRGRGVNSQKSFAKDVFVVNLGTIEAAYKSNEEVTPATLLEKRIVETIGGIIPPIKILGSGDITKSIIISGCSVSASAKTKIEKAGGSVKA